MANWQLAAMELATFPHWQHSPMLGSLTVYGLRRNVDEKQHGITLLGGFDED